eukprot:1157727-Pelagomonas_calceolata.AAC.15
MTSHTCTFESGTTMNRGTLPQIRGRTERRHGKKEAATLCKSGAKWDPYSCAQLTLPPPTPPLTSLGRQHGRQEAASFWVLCTRGIPRHGLLTYLNLKEKKKGCTWGIHKHGPAYELSPRPPHHHTAHKRPVQ